MKVAEKKDNAIRVINDSVLKVEWEKQIKNIHATIEGFEAEEIKVKDTDVKAVVITAYCTDGKTTIGALLKERRGYYYLDTDVAMVVCTGCIEGCKPQPVTVGRQFKLMCSTCNDCVKTEFSLNIP